VPGSQSQNRRDIRPLGTSFCLNIKKTPLPLRWCFLRCMMSITYGHVYWMTYQKFSIDIMDDAISFSQHISMWRCVFVGCSRIVEVARRDSSLLQLAEASSRTSTVYCSRYLARPAFNTLYSTCSDHLKEQRPATFTLCNYELNAGINVGDIFSWKSVKPIEKENFDL